jgi:predicted RNA-binding Zn ribbon-like protein
MSPDSALSATHGVPGHEHTAGLQDALDFVNTFQLTRDGPIDHLPGFVDALHWLDERELLHHEMVSDELARHTHDQAASEGRLRRLQRVRAALRELLDAKVEQRPADDAALREVNRAMQAHYTYELIPAPDGVSLDHRHKGDPIDGALAHLAEIVARELTRSTAARLRVCANDECRWVFHDSSPAGRRKWCDMATCGNRAKVARHRARQREVRRT